MRLGKRFESARRLHHRKHLLLDDQPSPDMVAYHNIHIRQDTLQIGGRAAPFR